MRYEPAERLLRLAFRMQDNREGLSLSDIQRDFKVSRSTAMRMRDAVGRVYGRAFQRSANDDERPRWFIRTRTVAVSDVAADDLANLALSADWFRQNNLAALASPLDLLSQKLKGRIAPKRQNLVATDSEILLQAEGLAMRPGPRPLIKSDLLATLRLAIKLPSELRLTYVGRRSQITTTRRVQPYGLLLGKQHYLVGMSPDSTPPNVRMFALGQIQKLKLLNSSFIKDPTFSLQKFAENSFGIFQEKPHDIVWKFSPAVAHLVLKYHFHPTQKVKKQADGSVMVRFRAGGLYEMCWHLYTWGSDVEVLEPKELRDLLPKAWMHRNYERT